jgi:phytoene synthase
MTYIVGVRAPYKVEQTLSFADSLSIAMQLSNFWRDVGQDYRIGRIYLPLEDMELFGVSEGDLRAGRITPAFVDLMEFEMARTEEYYRHAAQGVPRLAAGRWGVMAALEVYRAIHAGIRRNGYDVFSKRATTSKAQKLGLAVRAQWRLALLSARA